MVCSMMSRSLLVPVYFTCPSKFTSPGQSSRVLPLTLVGVVPKREVAVVRRYYVVALLPRAMGAALVTPR
jgi:hypothetical protein